MSKVTEMSDWVRGPLPEMDKRAEDLRARMDTVKARHDDLMNRMNAKLDDRDRELGDFEAMLTMLG